MPLRPLSEVLRSLNSEAEVRFTLRDIPLDELLLTLHEGRFTGSLDLGAMPEVDRVFFREGAVVGVVPYHHLDAQLLGGILVEMKKLKRDVLDEVLAQHQPMDGMILGQRLLALRLIDEEILNRACAEQARRRLFHLYENLEAPVLVREGLNRLAHFHPTFVDLRPAIAYGLVVRADTKRKEEIVHLARGRRARLISPYDEGRNSYGLPPPVLAALRLLSSETVVFDGEPRLPGLTADMTAGLLLLLHRMSLLHFEADHAPRIVRST